METEKMLMGQKQLQSWHLIKMVEGRKITLREAGEKMRVSCRQAASPVKGEGDLGVDI
jgi:hypothetical protein